MVGPYNITPVDIGGAISNWQNSLLRRQQQMLANRQLEREEREADRQNSIRQVLARAYGGDAGVTSKPTTETAGSATSAPETAAPTSSSAAAQPDRQQIFRDLLALDPEQAFRTMQAFGQMDEQQFQRTTRANGVLAREAYRLQQLPPEQRRAALRQAAPQLTQMGLTPEQIDGFDPTDENLSVIINQATDIDDLAARARPDWMNVEGELLDRNAIARGEDPVRWRSEYMNGPGGIYRRPNAGLAGRQPQTPAQSPEQLRAWADEAIRNGAPRDAVEQRLQQMLQGGASQPGSQTFP